MISTSRRYVAPDESRPLRRDMDGMDWRSAHHSQPGRGRHLLYGFLTTAPNAIVEPIHPKAMPVILTTDAERDVWMRGTVG
jgi:putative SOS response-associated peptidase YedK